MFLSHSSLSFASCLFFHGVVLGYFKSSFLLPFAISSEKRANDNNCCSSEGMDLNPFFYRLRWKIKTDVMFKIFRFQFWGWNLRTIILPVL
jgi:hypothetical protein